MTLKILSWNIWFDSHWSEVAKFLSNSKADIIGLQEIVPNEPARDTVKLLTDLGYQYALVPAKTLKDGRLMSNAIFSKYPIISSQTHDLSKEENRNAVQADIDVNGKILHVFSTHLLHTHQTPQAIQDEQIETLIKSIPTENSLVMGDFNATPDSTVIQKMKIKMQSNTDNIPTLNPNLFDCKICDPATVPHTRLDYIFNTPDLNVSNFTVEQSAGSDHYAISTQLEL